MNEFVKDKIIYRPKGIVDEYAVWLKSIARIFFGLMWAADGILKLSPDFQILPILNQPPFTGQNIFFKTWYAFWWDIISPIPQFWVFVISFTELGLAFCLIFGFMRKIGYVAGLFTSLVIWGVPEHFGGPYNLYSTNIGIGIVYAMAFVFLIVINAMEGPSKLSLDYYIEQRFHWWRVLAEYS